MPQVAMRRCPISTRRRARRLQQGAVDVNVRFANARRASMVDTQSTGSVRVPRPEVGYAFGVERLGFA